MVGPDTLANIIKSQWPDIIKHSNSYVIRTLHAITQCRTPALGGHLYQCNSCQAIHKRYHSCRNRHCPRCQNTDRRAWEQAQKKRLLPTTYYHVVFTIPSTLNEIFITFKRPMYALLMRTAWQTLQDFGWNHKYIGAQIGATLILHTWGSNLSYHPHVHCIVPAAGVNLKNKWINHKGKGKFLFPVKALSKVFRGKLIKELIEFLNKSGHQYPVQLNTQLYKNHWVVYAKKPFASPKVMIKYLSRYTHKIAITHHRIINYNQKQVTFSYTDYRHANQQKTMILSNREFIRRFSMHILPKGFTRIRHYGILSSSWRKIIYPNNKKSDTSKINWIELWLAIGQDYRKCPNCRKGSLIHISDIKPGRGPPLKINLTNHHGNN